MTVLKDRGKTNRDGKKEKEEGSRKKPAANEPAKPTERARGREREPEKGYRPSVPHEDKHSHVFSSTPKVFSTLALSVLTTLLNFFLSAVNVSMPSPVAVLFRFLGSG